ncbi:hypothetical protein AAHC03_0226 [Spirometra sp. Aus1]
MNARSDAPLPQPTAQNLVFHPSTVTQGALVGVTSGMQMWSQPTPQAILMTNIAGAANSPTGGTNTTVNNAFIRTPVSSMATASPGATPLIFAASTPDGTGLVRAPLPTQIVTSQLASAASATPPLTSFVLGTPSATPTSAAIVVSNISTPATAAATTSNTTQPAPVTITSSQSASTVLDQAQPPPSSPMPKVVSFQSVAVESPGTQSVAPTPPSQDSAAVAEVAPPAPALSVYSNSDASQSMVFTAKSLSDLVKETDPDLQLDDETEEALMQLSEEFVENVAEKAIRLAIHRGSPVVEAKDVKFSLDRDWNIFVPGFPSSEKTWKRPFVLQAHKQRLAIAKKQLKRT